jgi:antitoxin VapB
MDGFEERPAPPFERGPASRAKLFRHGGSQAVRLPKAFRFEGKEVEVRRDGDRVILTPIRPDRAPTPEERAAFWAEFDRLRGDDIIVRQPQPEFRDPGFDD